MERHLIDYVRRPELMDVQAVANLSDRVTKYPYFHAARVLLLKALYQQHDEKFDSQLRKASILLPSRESLFHIFESNKYLPTSTVPTKKQTTKSQDPTQQLLDNFLQHIPAQPRQRTQKVDASTDYIGYLMQQEGETMMSGAENDSSDSMDVIDKFLQNEPTKLRLEEKKDEEYDRPDMEMENNACSDVFTETLAQIYIKQGNFERAIEIIKRLSLKYPKKNRYFADQIRFLEKILINNKNIK